MESSLLQAEHLQVSQPVLRREVFYPLKIHAPIPSGPMSMLSKYFGFTNSGLEDLSKNLSDLISKSIKTHLI